MNSSSLYREILYRITHLLVLLFLPMIIPGYLVLRSLIGAGSEFKASIPYTIGILAGIPEALTVIFSRRRNLP